MSKQPQKPTINPTELLQRHNMLSESHLFSFRHIVDITIDETLKMLISEHSCWVEKGEEFDVQRKDHIDHFSGPGWIVFIKEEEQPHG
jgi:hypothetical protein